MKKILLTVNFFSLTMLLSLSVSAQNPAYPCGTPAGKSAWLTEYQKNPTAFGNLAQQRGGTGVTFLPLTIHIVGTDDSLGMAPFESVLASFCQLNKDFEAAQIQFFIEQPIRYIYESSFYSHDSVKKGGIKMLQYNVANTLNVYFVGNPAGNCGYNLPYAGIAMGNNCIIGHTFAHEMGHCLSLPHTFLGWEGGTSWNGTAVQSFPNPAPERVTINYTDFKDTLFLMDTLIIDTVYVENVPRTGPNANCSFASDGFCDTPSDYLAFRWFCSSTNSLSATRQLDPDSVQFQSDGWFIMSYAYDECQVGFSQEQINAMHAFIQSRRTNMLYNQNPFRDSVGQVSLLSPLANAVIAPQNPRFEWNATQGATHYMLEIFKEPYASNQVIEKIILTDTFYQTNRTFNPRPASFPYAWRVLPFNYGYTCSGFSLPNRFNTALSSGSNYIANSTEINWSLLPNIVSKGQSLKLGVSGYQLQNATVSVYSLTGQHLFSSNLELSLVQDLELNIPDSWSSGFYFVELKTENGYRATKKFIVR